MLSPYLFQKTFSILFKDSDSTVRSDALRCFVTYVIENDDDDRLIKELSPLMHQVVEVVCRYTCVNEDGGDDAPLQCLAELESVAPKLVNPHMAEILEMCVGCVLNTEKDEAFRHSATEVLATICECSTAVLKKRHAATIPFILKAVLLLMTHLTTELDEWLEVDDIDAEDDEEWLSSGHVEFQKIALHYSPELAAYCSISEDWRERHVALMGFSVIGEGCQRTMEPHIQDYLREIVPFLNDKVVPALMNTMMDASCARVSAHAAAALINFCEDCPKQIISAYLPAIMTGLEQSLGCAFQRLQTAGKKLCCEQITTAIASVADAAQDLFIDFYDRLVPQLKFILVNSTADEYKVLRGKTLESLSLIGVAVGKDKFRDDALAIMNLLKDQMPTLSSDDPQCSYMICSWTRICKVLGKEFAPYLPLIMGTVLQTASYKPEVAVVDEEFIPYVDEVAKLCMDNLRFLFVDSVRCSAAETLPWLLKCVKSQGLTKEDVEKITAVISDQLKAHEERRLEAEAEEVEEDADVDDLREKLTDEAEMEGEVLARISDLIHNMFEVRFMCLFHLIVCTVYMGLRACLLLQTFGEAFFDCVEPLLPSFVQLIDFHRAYPSRQYGVCYIDDCIEFAPRVSLQFSIFMRLAKYLFILQKKIFILCRQSCIVEFFERCARYQDQFVPLMLKCLADDYPEVRQAAAYGFGVMGMVGGAEYLNTVTTALEPLAAMVNSPEARLTEESSGATDNGIAAVAKILKYSGANIDITQVVPAFLSWLPTHEDVTEAPHIYGYLADLIESNHPAVLGDNNSNLPRIVFIIVSAFLLEAFPQTDEGTAVAQRLQHILKVLHNNTEMFEAVVQAAHLDEKRTETLRGLIS
ncbi:unnamed protein product [Strongylus vulgaris]|uniref:IPO4/5-like TPR repeats domain-containing protein n=1 Tax=Strongylus vulgaris TaxID=40348 RepID=A0A3P7L841_STRVU|nr:unnamed protein product [Strongylus vulgaris]